MIYILKQDGVEKFRSEDKNDVMTWVHKHTSYSWAWAEKYEKFTITEEYSNVCEHCGEDNDPNNGPVCDNCDVCNTCHSGFCISGCEHHVCECEDCMDDQMACSDCGRCQCTEC